MSTKLKKGDTVIWRGSWGRDIPQEAIVDCIEVNCEVGYGIEVNSVHWSNVNDRSVVVDLNNGHWAYGFQLSQIK